MDFITWSPPTKSMNYYIFFFSDADVAIAKIKSMADEMNVCRIINTKEKSLASAAHSDVYNFSLFFFLFFNAK